MNVVLHVNSATAETMSPTMRICHFVADTLELPKVYNEGTAAWIRMRLRYDPLDILFVKPGILKFSRHREDCLDLYRRAKRVVYLENDYTMKWDSRFTKIRQPDYTWSMLRERDAYCNWNVLTYLPPETWVEPQPFPTPIYERLLYYGAYRPGRISSFRDFLAPLSIPMTISTFRGQAQFHQLCPQAYVMGRLSPGDLPAYAMMLYLTDDYNHKVFTSPANRFYECLQVGVAMLFDARCIGHFGECGFDIRPYAVETHEDVERMFPLWPQIRQAQRVNWWDQYHLQLAQQIKDAYAKLEEN